MLGETALVTALFGSVIAAQLGFSRSFCVFGRWFWLDELMTFRLVTDRGLAHSLHAIVGGLDTNPPSYHLLLRVLRPLLGRFGEVTLRSIALLSILAALVGLYANLRQAFAPPAAFTAVLVVWAHPLIMEHAFEARMYGPWLAAVVWFSYFLTRFGESPGEPWLGILLAVTSLLACTLHTMGAIAVGLVLSFHLFFHHKPEQGTFALAPAGLGPLVSLAWLQFMWRQAFAYATPWMGGPTWDNVRHLLGSVLPPRTHLAIILLGGGTAPFLPRIGGTAETLTGTSDPGILAGVVGLLFLPIVLTTLSFVHPLMNDRYALPTIAAFAPPIAFILSPLPAFWTAALCILLILVGCKDLRRHRDVLLQQGREHAELVSAIRKHTTGGRVVFESPHQLFVVCHYAPDLAHHCHGLDFEPHQLGHADNYLIACRDLMRIHARFYPEPSLIPWESLRGLPKLVIVPASEYQNPSFTHFSERYVGYAPQPIEAGLCELTTH